MVQGIIMIIIIYIYGACILRNLSSEAQQNIIIKHNREQGCASHYHNEGQPKLYGGNAVWNKYVEFFWKIVIVSDVFKVADPQWNYSKGCKSLPEFY